MHLRQASRISLLLLHSALSQMPTLVPYSTQLDLMPFTFNFVSIVSAYTYILGMINLHLYSYYR